MNLESFQQALQEHPEDRTLRLVFADWLQEQDDPRQCLRGELLRLSDTLTQSIDVPGRSQLEACLSTLVAQGVRPVGPYYTNAIGMEFAWVPVGTFLMGSPVRQSRLTTTVTRPMGTEKMAHTAGRPPRLAASRPMLGA